MRSAMVAGRWQWPSVLILCLLAGLLSGALAAFLEGPLALALVVGLLGALVLLRSPMLSLFGVIGVVILLPFAAVPLGVGFNPTFLNLTLGALLAVWAVRVLTRDRGRIELPPVVPAILGFILLAVFAFILGLGHAPLSPNVLRHFAEFLLAIGLSLVLVNVLETEEQLSLAVRALILAGGAAAAIGVFLYVLPDSLALRLLSPLRYLEYNVGLRYIRDDPRLPERAIGTSVDPNAFGGLLLLVTALTVAQIFSCRPLLPRSVTVSLALIMALCLVLTFSRSAMAGLVVALSLIAILHDRRLVIWMALGGVLFLLLPQTQGYINHFVAGLRGQDLATRMRFGEYSDALRLIQRHPWFGVGFAGVPEIDIYLGVSSLYLLLAETMGLIGMAAFLVTMGLFFTHVADAWRRMTDARLRSVLLGLTTALAGAMASGIFDHYFVNINFPASVTLFWMFVGLALAAARLGADQEKADHAPPGLG